MALVWCDGFEGYGAEDADPSPVGILSDKYASINQESQFTVRSGLVGQALQGAGAFYQTYLRSDTLTSNATLIAGCSFRNYDVDDLTHGHLWPLFSFRSSSANKCAELILSQDTFYVLDAAQNYLGGIRGKIDRQIYHFIEMKVYSHATAGTIEVRINGCPVFQASSVNTLNVAQADKVAIGDFSLDTTTAEYCRLDNYYVCDGSGSTNNDFLGDVNVRTLFPDGDSTVNFTTTGNAGYGTHYQQVNAADALLATDYVEDSTTGNRDIFTTDNATDNFATIHGVVGWAEARYETAAATYRLVCSANSAETESANIVCQASFQYDKYILEDDPSGNPWTNSTVNSMLWGLEVQ